MTTTNATDRFLATARRQRFFMLRDLCEAAAMASLTLVTLIALF
jgi:hypothetical protein